MTAAKNRRALLTGIALLVATTGSLLITGCKEKPASKPPTPPAPTPALNAAATPPEPEIRELTLLFPDSEPLAPKSSPTLLPKVTLEVARPKIIGFEYEVKSEGTASAVVRPANFYAYDAAGKELRKDWIDYRFGELAVTAGPEWHRGRFEVMVLPGTASVALELAITPVAITNLQQLKLDQPGNQAVASQSQPGVPQILLRNLRVVQGGFDPDAIFPGAPYLPWIEGLKANREYAAKMRFADAEWRDLAPRYLWANWLPKIALSKGDPEHWRRQVQPYLDLSPEALAALFPSQPPVLKMGFEFPTVDDLSLGGLTWEPSHPDQLRRADGTVFMPDAEFQATGSADYVAPNGQRGALPYRETAGPGGKVTREYRDAVLARAKVNTMLRAAFAMAVLYRITGDEACAIRAGVILDAFAKAVPGWPNIGTAEGAEGEIFSPADPGEYRGWMRFVLGGWYPPSTGSMTWLAKTYDLIKDAPVWDRVNQAVGSDARDRIAAGFLYVMRESLLRDAYFRFSPWALYHNTTGLQIEAMIAVGRAIGSPDLIHYAVRKLDQAATHYLMADGSFPESPTYGHDQIGSYKRIYDALKGYCDPSGYVSSLDGTRFDNFTPEGRFPLFDRAVKILDRQVFPDGSVWSLADSWPQDPKPEIARPASAWIMPDFGHAVLGRGKGRDAIESHLEYSGFDNHSHKDTLNLTLWAYGDELVSDIGYTHFGGYTVSAISHNLVLVDGRDQNFFLIRRNDLMTWAGHPDLTQVTQVQQGNPPSNPQASIYRRALVSVPFGAGREAVLDLFEVKGGKRHEWMANGAAAYAQNLATSLVPERTLGSLAPDEKLVTDPGKFPLKSPMPGGERLDHLYGVFRNASVGKNDRPWQATMTAAPPVAPGMPGAFARAMSKEAKPGLRLHWLAPLDGEAIFCEAPRHRYANEQSIWAKEAAFTKWWNENLMKKIIVRREGEKLDSLFFAVWEPFQGGQAPWLQQVENLPVAPANEGAAARLQAGNDTATVLYRKPEATGEVTAGDLRSTARFAVHRRVGDWEFLELVDGVSVAAGPTAIEISPWPELQIVTQGMTGKGETYLDVSGDLSAYPASTDAQPHAGTEIRLQQPGQASWWLPLARVENPGKEGGRLVFQCELGFRYDPASATLQERFYPFRTIGGKASIFLPAHAALKWRTGGPDLPEAQVLSTAPVMIRYGSVATPVKPTAGWLALPSPKPINPHQ